jgi:ethanolamine utilization protein EutA
VALSRQEGTIVLHVDIGGGTTKLALIRDGTIVATAAIAVGGRLLAFDAAGRLVRCDESARVAALAADAALRVGEVPDRPALERVIDALAEALVATITCRATALGDALMLTEAMTQMPPPHEFITFSGGVAEYIYSRETRTFDDIAQPLSARIAEAARAGRFGAPMRDPGQGIRATVIGASQFSVQLSGKTIHLPSNLALPVHNIPVLAPMLPLEDTISPEAVAKALAHALAQSDRSAEAPVAVAVKWRGDPHYARLRALAQGIALVFADHAGGAPLVVIVDCDIARTLGHILQDELASRRAIVVIDGIVLRELDYVDIGRLIEPAQVVPVVIKSLLFASGHHYLRRRH